MAVLFGIWFAVAGGVAVLAGLSARYRARRLRRSGTSAWATGLAPAAVTNDQPGEALHRAVIQYTLTDGRVLEHDSPQPVRKSARLNPGQQVLIWYDTEDPHDVLVYGREGRLADRAFVLAGLLIAAIGIAIAASG